MGTRTISFRIDSEKVDSLDRFAASLKRDRSFLLNEAISNYLDLQSRQIAQIKKSLKQAAEGDLTSQEDVEKLAKTWGRHR